MRVKRSIKILAKFRNVRLLVEHLPISILIGLLGYGFSGNPYCVPSALLAGWCLDIDHLYDFLLDANKSKKLNIDFIRSGQYFKKNDKIIFPLHAWEITVALILIGVFSNEYAYIFFTAAFAHGSHLMQDQLLYRTRALGYSIISRMFNNFNYKSFCRVTDD
jgi:hypothetical protein